MSPGRRPITVPIPPGRVAAVDYGRKRMGIAICDAERIIASPWPMRQPTGDPTAEAAYFRRLVAEESIVGFVVGLPVHADGSDSRMSVEVEKFAGWLGETTGRPVTFQDERYTSVEAAGMLAGLGLSRGRRRPGPTRSRHTSSSPPGWRRIPRADPAGTSKPKAHRHAQEPSTIERCSA
jgi:putative Holliday junction resolvase